MVGFETSPFCSPDEILQGLTYTPEDVKSYGLLVLRSSNIQNGHLVFDDTVYVDCKVDSDRLVRKGDIIICVRNGSSALIGKCAIAKRDYNATWGAFMVCVRSDHNEFLYQVFQSDIIQKQIHGKSNATINQITNRDFRELTIPLPPLPEQHRIAAVLSDTDVLITALEKLIAKKRNIKKGAMQELLTGKRRLPGFSGEWEEKTLEQIMRIRKERINPALYENVRCIELEHLESTSGHLLDWAESKNQRSLKAVFQCGDVLFGKLRPYLRKYYTPYFSGLCSTEFWVLTTIDDAVVNPYIYHLVQTHKFLDIANSTTGTKMPRSDWSLMKHTVFNLASETREQTAIAEVLSDMDAEIDALTAKLNKVRNIKQGMMQELLTGHIQLFGQEVKPQ